MKTTLSAMFATALVFVTILANAAEPNCKRTTTFETAPNGATIIKTHSVCIK